MSSGPVEERLACGRSAADVLAQVGEGRAGDRDAHQQHCPHCQAALAEYDRLWAPVLELAAEKITAPESIVENALRRIRSAVEFADYGVLESPDGLVRISVRVVVAIARETAQGVPGVRVALSKSLTGAGDSPSGGAHASAGVAGASTAIEITLAADYGQDLHLLGERVRAEVTRRVRALTDLQPIHVTVIIDDVLA
jgi:uncharacterized alkaline shock family protein YloU